MVRVYDNGVCPLLAEADLPQEYTGMDFVSYWVPVVAFTPPERTDSGKVPRQVSFTITPKYKKHAPSRRFEPSSDEDEVFPSSSSPVPLALPDEDAAATSEAPLEADEDAMTPGEKAMMCFACYTWHSSPRSLQIHRQRGMCFWFDDKTKPWEIKCGACESAAVCEARCKRYVTHKPVYRCKLCDEYHCSGHVREVVEHIRHVHGPLRAELTGKRIEKLDNSTCFRCGAGCGSMRGRTVHVTGRECIRMPYVDNGTGVVVRCRTFFA
jgi:hypothetical protein